MHSIQPSAKEIFGVISLSFNTLIQCIEYISGIINAILILIMTPMTLEVFQSDAIRENFLFCFF